VTPGAAEAGMDEARIVVQPRAASSSSHALVLLFHGVGASADDLVPLAEALAPQLPEAWIVSVNAPDVSDAGHGRQWFSVRGITEQDRPARVAAALPRFIEVVQAWQRRTGVDAARTALVGFSQGAIMALAATQLDESPARRVFAIAGRFAEPARIAPPATAVHILHGTHDLVMPVALARDAAQRLQTLGAEVTLDIFTDLGHAIDGRVVQRLVDRLRSEAPAGGT
jgi:phospholipase/carboxylesterase